MKMLCEREYIVYTYCHIQNTIVIYAYYKLLLNNTKSSFTMIFNFNLFTRSKYESAFQPFATIGRGNRWVPPNRHHRVITSIHGTFDNNKLYIYIYSHT